MGAFGRRTHTYCPGGRVLKHARQRQPAKGQTMNPTSDSESRIHDIVHDLRGTLAIISAYAQRLEEPDLDEAERGELLATIHRNVERMRGLIDKILLRG